MYLREALVDNALFLLDDLGDLEDVDPDTFLYRFDKMLGKIGWSLDVRVTDKRSPAGATMPDDRVIMIEIPAYITTEEIVAIVGHELIHVIYGGLGVFDKYYPALADPFLYLDYFYQPQELLARSFNLAYGLIVEGESLMDLDDYVEDVAEEACRMYQADKDLQGLKYISLNERLHEIITLIVEVFLRKFPKYYHTYIVGYGILFLLDLDRSPLIASGIEVDMAEENFERHIRSHKRLRNLVKKYKRRIAEFV